MKRNLQIIFRGMRPSEALANHIRDHAAKLERFFEGIDGCHVVVEEPHRHQRQGRHFHVRVDLRVPGKDIVVGHEHCDREADEDAYRAVNDAFDVARRRLRHYAEGLREHH